MVNDLKFVGNVKAIRKDFKALMMDNDEWYNSFTKIDHIKKDDKIELFYNKNEKNGKIFNNIISLNIIDVEKQIKETSLSSYDIENKNLKLHNPMDINLLSTIIICATDIKINRLGVGEDIPYSVIVDEIISSIESYF